MCKKRLWTRGPVQRQIGRTDPDLENLQAREMDPVEKNRWLERMEKENRPLDSVLFVRHLDSYDPLVNPYVFCFGLLRPFSQPLCVLFWTLTTL